MKERNADSERSVQKRSARGYQIIISDFVAQLPSNTGSNKFKARKLLQKEELKREARITYEDAKEQLILPSDSALIQDTALAKSMMSNDAAARDEEPLMPQPVIGQQQIDFLCQHGIL